MEWRSFLIDETVYSQDAVLMTATDLADTFVLQLSHRDNQLELKLRLAHDDEFDENHENIFLQRLAHNEIRVRLRKTFAPIENAIVKKAFTWDEK